MLGDGGKGDRLPRGDGEATGDPDGGVFFIPAKKIAGNLSN